MSGRLSIVITTSHGVSVYGNACDQIHLDFVNKHATITIIPAFILKSLKPANANAVRKAAKGLKKLKGRDSWLVNVEVKEQSEEERFVELFGNQARVLFNPNDNCLNESVAFIGRAFGCTGAKWFEEPAKKLKLR